MLLLSQLCLLFPKLNLIFQLRNRLLLLLHLSPLHIIFTLQLLILLFLPLQPPTHLLQILQHLIIPLLTLLPTLHRLTQLFSHPLILFLLRLDIHHPPIIIVS